MDAHNEKNPPGYSIDEALNLYLSMLYPGGLPEGEEKDKIVAALREKIASERPEWAEASGIKSEKKPPQNYAGLKDQIVKEAQKEEVPEDPEERYLYERRKEARQNREKKAAEEKEAAKNEEVRRRLIEQNRDDNKETIERALLIRNALEKRAAEVLKNRHEASLSHTPLKNSSSPSLTQPTNLKTDFSNQESMGFGTECPGGSNFSHRDSTKPLKQNVSATEKFFRHQDGGFFNDHGKRSLETRLPISKEKPRKKPESMRVDEKEDSMSLDEKIDYLQRYNKNRRAMMKTKEEAISMSGSDERFSMEMGLGNESGMKAGSSSGKSKKRSRNTGGLKL